MQQNASVGQDLGIIILSSNEANARTDRKCLRNVLRQEPEMFTSGVEAAYRLTSQPQTLVICDEHLSDMTGLDFVRLVRLHPDLQNVPLLFVSVDNQHESVLGAMAAGCTRYLLRPYSLVAFSKSVMAALQMANNGLQQCEDMPEPSLQAFEAALEGWGKQQEEEAPDPLQEAMSKAMALLASRQYKPARDYFRTALLLAPENPAAHHGLARCWLALGHPAQARESLRVAAEAYLQTGDYRHARKVYEELQKRDPDAKDPISSSLETLLRRGDVEGAAEVLKQAHERGDVPINVVQHIARACHFTADPQAVACNLCDTLEDKGASAPAMALRGKLLGGVSLERKNPVMLVEEEEEAPLSGWGNLRTVFEVAKFTIQSYRRNSQPEQA